MLGQNKNRQSLSTIRSKTYSVIYLCILLFYLIRPALPYIEYAIDKEYITENLCINRNKPINCCQGKCYLNEQIKKIGEPLNSNKDNNKKIVPDQKVEDHLPSNGITSKSFEIVSLLNNKYITRIFDSYLPSFFVPPRA